jgi:hypothetical protein
VGPLARNLMAMPLPDDIVAGIVPPRKPAR